MDIRDVFERAKVIPVLTLEGGDTSIELARALVAGGLSVLEITLRTKGGLAAAERIAAEMPDAVVGVGTVTQPEEFRRALDAGARFAVSPGFTEELGRAALAARIPYMPAVQTASEIIAARRLGFTALKFFPAKVAGGIQALKAFAPVFPDVVFCPTGGVTASDFVDYLRLDNVIATGGSWMAPPEMIKNRDWRAIEALARQASAAFRATAD